MTANNFIGARIVAACRQWRREAPTAKPVRGWTPYKDSFFPAYRHGAHLISMTADDRWALFYAARGETVRTEDVARYPTLHAAIDAAERRAAPARS